MMPTGKNSTDNSSQEVLKAESGNSFDVVLNSGGLSSSPEGPLEDCLHFEGGRSGEESSSHRSSAAECHLRSASDRAYGDSVVSLADGGECADVRKLLMHQIRSFLLDPDIDVFSKSRSHLDDSSLKQGVQNDKLNLEMKEVTELPLEDICTADSAVFNTEAIINKSQSYNHLNTVVDYGNSERGNNIMTEDWCNYRSESDNNQFDFDFSKFFGDEGEDFDSMLQLLLHIRGICFEEESLSKQESLDVKQLEASEERNHLTAEEHPEVIDDAACVTAAALPSNDSPDKNSEYVKEHVESLWKQINEIFKRKQFSSAVVLRQHLETVEKIKNATGLWLQRQKDSERNSEGFPDNMKFEKTKFLEELSTRANSNMTHLSDKLVQWQDFNEIRADLEYELAKEQDSLESIEDRINSENASLDAGHDLKLVEEMENNYCERLKKLRRCNRDLEGLLDDKTRENHRSQLGTLANQLQYIKMSCSRLRKSLDLPCLPLTNDDCLPSGEQKEGSHSVYSQTDDDDDDNDGEVPASVSIVKMLLLLMLIVLFFAVFFFFLKPHWYHQVNSFRLPVLYHLRHVGTFPPV